MVEVDRFNNGGGCKGDFDRKFHPRLQLRSNMMRLMGAGVVRVVSQSKSCQEVEELSRSPKNLKGLKSCKGQQFGGMFTKAPILCRKTRAFVLLGPRSSLEATSASIIDKAKLMELLILCHVVLQRSQEDLQAKDTQIFHQV